MSEASKAGREDDVAHQIQGVGEVRVERVDVEARVLLGGEGVDVSPEAVDGPGDLDVRPPAGSA